MTTGQFIYFGDNKTPGHQLHETTRGGNEILRRAFEFLHASPPMRAMVPPFLSSRDTQLPLAAGPCSSKDWRSLGSLACRQQPTRRCLENDRRATLSELSRDFHSVGRSCDRATPPRGSVDGGRDAIGRYLLGLSDDPVYAEFSLEAKCYQPGFDETSPNTVGVREVSRLISRIRHRQFGVLVTTSVIARQAYEEVREDRHPIIFFSGGDITDILVNNGFNTPELVTSFLYTEFSLTRNCLTLSIAEGRHPRHFAHHRNLDANRASIERTPSPSLGRVLTKATRPFGLTSA